MLCSYNSNAMQKIFRKSPGWMGFIDQDQLDDCYLWTNDMPCCTSFFFFSSSYFLLQKYHVTLSNLEISYLILIYKKGDNCQNHPQLCSPYQYPPYISKPTFYIFPFGLMRTQTPLLLLSLALSLLTHSNRTQLQSRATPIAMLVMTLVIIFYI